MQKNTQPNLNPNKGVTLSPKLGIILTWKRLFADFALLLAVVEMPPDMFDVCSLRAKLHWTQLTLE